MTPNGFLFWLCLTCCGGTIFTHANDYDGLMCEEKATIFNTLTERFRHLLTQPDNRASTICPKLAEYISHAVITRDTCPSLPLVRNTTFRDTVLLMSHAFTTRCVNEGYTIQRYGCSSALVTYLVDKCNKMVDRVQFSLPRLEVCQISREFIACLEQAQDLCNGAHAVRLFRARHVPQAIQVTRDSLDYLCDPLLKDVPWEHGPSNSRNPRSLEETKSESGALCPNAIKAGKSVADFCTEKKEIMFPGVTLGSDYESICRVFSFMRECSTSLFDHCDGFVSEEEKSYFLNNYQTVLKAYGCLPTQ